MQIVFNIAEDSNVELVKGEYELVQGECCVTELKFNFPATIRGISSERYKKHIEFGECKELGECVKFVDDIVGDIYELKDNATAFKKLMVQLVLSYQDIVWKTIPVVLEFHESVNAEGTAVIQAQLLRLSAIEQEWENYIKAHTIRIIQRVTDIPTANVLSLGDTIFYLGANTDTAPLLVYGHYYRCNRVNGVYEWTDLTQDPSLAGVADGIREINKNQTLQFWKGTTEELENEVPQENVGYIDEDISLQDVLNAYVPDIPVKNAECANKSATAQSLLIQELQVETIVKSNPVQQEGIYFIHCTHEYGSGIVHNVQFVLHIYDLDEEAHTIAHFMTSNAIACSNVYYETLYNTIQSTNSATKIKKIYFIPVRVGGNATVQFYGELSASSEIAYFEAKAVNGSIAVGNKLHYMGEVAEVTEYDSDYNLYRIKLDVGGAFYAAANGGETVSVEVQ